MSRITVDDLSLNFKSYLVDIRGNSKELQRIRGGYDSSQVDAISIALAELAAGMAFYGRKK